MTQTAEAPIIGIITYSDEVEERIARLEAERDYYREAYNQLSRDYNQLSHEKKFVDRLFEVKPEKLTTGHKATIHATVRYLREHDRERDERGYIKMNAYDVASMAGHEYGTVLNHWGVTSREMRIRDGIEVETDIGRVPVFDRLVVRVKTDDRVHYPQGYYLETYMRERDVLPHPEQYKAQTPIEWGGKRKDAGRKKCQRCGSWMKAKDHIRTVQREHICPNCGTHEWDETRTVSDDMPVEDVERAIASKNQVDFCPPGAHVEPVEASKPVLDEVYAPPLLHQVESSPTVSLTHALPPEALRSLPIWCCHRAKEPYNARPARVPQKAKSNDPATWSTYEQTKATFEASQGWKHPYDGIGFMCNGEFTGIDLDHCINEQGEISDQALDLVALFGSYTYITPSGEGLRIVIHAKKPGDRCRWPGIEIYNQVRFFTWTPDHLVGTPEEIADGQAELDALYKELVPDVPKSEIISDLPRPLFTRSGSDDEILNKARNGKNGAKFIDLYDRGSWKAWGYPSQSEADAGLCEMLLYWGDGDVSTLDRLFPNSGLMRDKWKRADYREATISAALRLYRRQERRAS